MNERTNARVRELKRSSLQLFLFYMQIMSCGKTSGEDIFPKNMISPEQMNMIYTKTDSTVKNREYALAKTFESVFDEDTFFNSCLLVGIRVWLTDLSFP